MNIFNKSEFEASAVSVEPSFFDPVSRCVVLAPHPDDESLGCGGLIALLRNKGIQVKVILTTDGAKSHPNSKLYPAQQLAELRKMELIEALRCLEVDAGDISFYNGPDSKLSAKGDAGFDGYSNRMAEELLSFLPQLILVPYELDPHCDHRATWQMLQQALTSMGNFSGMVWEYPIWLYENASLEDLPNLQHGELKSLDISDFMMKKKAAIYAHKSQTTRLISDDPKGFLLTEAMIANFTSGTEYYLQREMLNAGFTLSEDYFEKMYAQHPDPWNFEQSEYEKLKYEATLHAIPDKQYKKALEIGCSIGVLTRMLALKCDELLSIDISNRALETARYRLKDQPHVHFEQAAVPDGFPRGNYDLIVMSEVGYYLSMQDLSKTIQRIEEQLNTDGILILVHWTHFVEDYPLTGDQVHECFRTAELQHLHGHRTPDYRLDVYAKK